MTPNANARFISTALRARPALHQDNSISHSIRPGQVLERNQHPVVFVQPTPTRQHTGHQHTCCTKLISIYRCKASHSTMHVLQASRRPHTDHASVVRHVHTKSTRRSFQSHDV
ncbi:hypothetical protein N5P37_001509 [Trichoderma harzianum]|nr:hypothetical protein N5P37_001509 [Trichoderma harzianum]